MIRSSLLLSKKKNIITCTRRQREEEEKTEHNHLQSCAKFQNEYKNVSNHKTKNITRENIFSCFLFYLKEDR